MIGRMAIGGVIGFIIGMAYFGVVDWALGINLLLAGGLVFFAGLYIIAFCKMKGLYDGYTTYAYCAGKALAFVIWLGSWTGTPLW